MSTKIIPKRGVANPETASLDDAVQMIRTRAEPRLAEVPSFRKFDFVFLDVFVTRPFERPDTTLGLSKLRYTNHDVDHGLCPEPRNRSCFRRAR